MVVALSWICECFSDVCFVFLWFLCSRVHFANTEILSFHGTVNEQSVFQSILILSCCNGGWLALQEGLCLCICMQKSLLQKHRKDTKKAHIYSSYPDWQPLGWKPIVLMSAQVCFCTVQNPNLVVWYEDCCILYKI